MANKASLVLAQLRLAIQLFTSQNTIDFKRVDTSFKLSSTMPNLPFIIVLYTMSLALDMLT